ncbi:MAG: efflux RND transporter periplasmic adaptor subunit [Acidobacteria bacterium]|nr:efflux RND transporter periplasmic adaptor subunit [Acidobacteriota bacterium]
MRRSWIRLVLLLGLAVAGGAYYYVRARPAALVLTGIVTTDDVRVSAQVPGQIARLLVKEGDAVARGQLLAELRPDELQAESVYFAQAAAGASSQVQQSEAALRWERQQVENQVAQAEAAVAAAEAAQRSAEADLERARLTFERNRRLVDQGVVAAEEFDQSRTAHDALAARVASLARQTDAARAAAAIARSNAEQVAIRQSQVQASRFESAAARAQRRKADVRLAYTQVLAPAAGIVDVRAAREGEVVTAGQPIVSLIDPDDLWVRADVEESYIDRVRVGDSLTIRLPSGAERPGVIFYRGADAGFATQRDVSRTKRDIRTFEIRLRADNRDRRLAVGMTAYVLMPVGQ